MSRCALESLLEVFADDVRDDPEVWLPIVFPPSHQVLDQAQLAVNTRNAALNLMRRLNSGVEFPALNTAEEIILYYVIEAHRQLMEQACVEAPWVNLEDSLLEDIDFLFLFDAEFAGLETSPVAAALGMTITGPEGWFQNFRDA